MAVTMDVLWRFGVRQLIAGLMFVAAVVCGLLVGVWVAVLGIVDMVDGVKLEPTDGLRAFWGFIEFWFLSWGLGGVVFVLLALIAASISASDGGRVHAVIKTPFGIGLFDSGRQQGGGGTSQSPLGSSAFRSEFEWKRRMTDE